MLQGETPTCPWLEWVTHWASFGTAQRQAQVYLPLSDPFRAGLNPVPPPTLQRLPPDWWTQNYGRSLTPVIAIRTTWSAKTVGLEEVVATMQSRWYPFSVIDE